MFEIEKIYSMIEYLEENTEFKIFDYGSPGFNTRFLPRTSRFTTSPYKSLPSMYRSKVLSKEIDKCKKGSSSFQMIQTYDQENINVMKVFLN